MSCRLLSWEYGGSAEINFKLDFQKLGLWPGAFINGRATSQFGKFANENTGAITAVNIDGMFPLPDYDGVAVPQLVFTQFLSESFSIFFGKILEFGVDGVLLATIISTLLTSVIMIVQYYKLINNQAKGIWNA